MATNFFISLLLESSVLLGTIGGFCHKKAEDRLSPVQRA